MDLEIYLKTASGLSGVHLLNRATADMISGPDRSWKFIARYDVRTDTNFSVTTHHNASSCWPAAARFTEHSQDVG